MSSSWRLLHSYAFYYIYKTQTQRKILLEVTAIRISHWSSSKAVTSLLTLLFFSNLTSQCDMRMKPIYKDSHCYSIPMDKTCQIKMHAFTLKVTCLCLCPGAISSCNPRASCKQLDPFLLKNLM